MSLADVQVRRLGVKALLGAAKQMETTEITFERMTGANDVSVAHFMLTAEDGQTKQEFPGFVLLVLAETDATRDAAVKQMIGRVPGKE